MAGVDFDRVSEAFGAAMAAREAGVAVGDLTQLCHGDAAVAAEVRSLLDHLGRVGDTSIKERPGNEGRAFLDCDELRRDHGGETTPALLNEWGASSVGQQVGPYTLLGQLGSGGMAFVFVAEQDRPRRKVALKMVRRQAASDHLFRRFEREAELHGCLSHPGIAQVYNAGVAKLIDDAGRAFDVPYLAMELVQGPNIADFCRAFGCEMRLVLTLVAQVCDAVQHAHQRGVIHRDLKPANVLVTGGSRGEATAKVLDFGIARYQADDGPDAPTRLTQHGYIVGTLAYMSPEQIGSSCDVDTRGDVYAIGVMLFELLSGEQPIDLDGCGLAEAARRIADSQPLKLGTLDRRWRGDVETIVAKALDKDPAARYQSPAELADDLRSYLEGRPIQARRDSLAYALSKRMARYRNLALVTSVLMVVGVVGAGYVHEEQNQKLKALTSEANAMRREAAARKVADSLSVELAERLSASRIGEGRLLSAGGAWIDAERLLWDEYLQHPNSLNAHWALRELYLRSGCRATADTQFKEGHCLAAGPNGLVATGGNDGTVRLFHSTDARPGGTVISGLKDVHAATFVGEGRTLAVVGVGGAWLVPANVPKRLLTPASAAAVFAGPSLLAVGDDDGQVRLFTHNGDPLTAVKAAASPVKAVAFDRAETHLAVIYLDGAVRLWDVRRDGERVDLRPGPPVAGHATYGRTVAFSPDGRTLASGAGDQMVRLWRVADGQPIAAVRTRNGTARDVVFHPDGRRIAVAGYWRTQLYELTGDAPYVVPCRNIDGESVMCRFAEEGQVLLTISSAGVCRAWDLEPPKPLVLRTTSDAPVGEMAVARYDGRPLLLAVQDDGTVSARAWSSVGEWRPVAEWSLHHATHGLAYDAVRRQFWAGRDDGHVLAYDLVSGRINDALPGLGAAVRTINLSDDGRTLIVGLGGGAVQGWRRDAGRWAKAFEGVCGNDVRGATVSHDGRTLLTTHRMSTVRVWSLADHKILGEMTQPTAAYRPDLSPDGRQMATGSWDRSVRVWDTAAFGPAARPRLTLVGHNQLVSEVTFDETGRLLASVATDGQWRLWDLSDRADGADAGVRELRCLTTHDPDPVEAVTVRFLPSEPGTGQHVVTGGRDGTVRVWDLDAGEKYLDGNIEYERGQFNAAATRPARTPGAE